MEETELNQILVTEKIYVTPELKKKKKIYKIEFFLSIILICLFSSYYIHAAYDRDKSEEVSQIILTEIPLQGKSGSIGMTTEIEQEVAATLDG